MRLPPRQKRAASRWRRLKLKLNSRRKTSTNTWTTWINFTATLFTCKRKKLRRGQRAMKFNFWTLKLNRLSPQSDKHSHNNQLRGWAGFRLIKTTVVKSWASWVLLNLRNALIQRLILFCLWIRAARLRWAKWSNLKVSCEVFPDLMIDSEINSCIIWARKRFGSNRLRNQSSPKLASFSIGTTRFSAPHF